MVNTQFFVDLDSNIKSIKQVFLPRFDPMGQYSDQELHQARAFKLFCHAELEYYFEEVCRYTVNESLQQFRSANAAKIPLIAIGAYNSFSRIDLPASLRNQQSSHSLDLSIRLQTIIKAYSDHIDHNNGVKESDLIKMLIPIGIPHSLLVSLLPDLNSYGSIRGQQAHKAFGAIQTLDPQTEWNTICAILDKIKALDEHIVFMLS